MEYKVIKEENTKQWFDNNNKLVKEILYYENAQKRYESYWLNDQRHREDGSSVKRWYENGQKSYEEYWLNGKELTKNEFIIYQKKKKLKLFL